jgi:hypothetical protein
MSTPATSRRPAILLALAVVPLVFSCAFVAWYFLVHGGLHLEEPTWFGWIVMASLLAYPLSVLLLLAGLVIWWRQGRAGTAQVLALVGAVLVAWAAPPALIYWLEDIDLPAVLRHADADNSGPRFFACGRENEPYTSGDTVSPNVSERIARRFPPGASSRELEAWLLSQDFGAPKGACPNDHGIRFAFYSERDRLDSLQVKLYWKTDAAGRIVWTRATISHLTL